MATVVVDEGTNDQSVLVANMIQNLVVYAEVHIFFQAAALLERLHKLGSILNKVVLGLPTKLLLGFLW